MDKCRKEAESEWDHANVAGLNGKERKIAEGKKRRSTVLFPL